MRAATTELCQRGWPTILPLMLAKPKDLVVLHDVCQDSTAGKDGMLAIRWILDSDLNLARLGPLHVSPEHPLGIQGMQILFESRWKSRKHGRSTGQDNMPIQVGTNVNVGRLDGSEDLLGQARTLSVNEVGLEEDFWRFEALGGDFDKASIGELPRQVKETIVR